MQMQKGFEFLALDSPVQVLDVGAAAISEIPVYAGLLDKGYAVLSAFEGDERQIEKIIATYGPRTRVYRDFLFDGLPQKLYIANAASGMTSLLRPRADALRFFNGFEAFGEVLAVDTVQTKRLDDIEDLPGIDFLKMDIQGAELTVLRNGASKLKDCLAVQLEVSWICLYEDQPSFGDVDVWMRSEGFVPHCLLDLKRWSIAPTIFNGNFRIPGNQLLESDIVYIRDPLRLDLVSTGQLVKMVLISHFALGSYDLYVFLIRDLERRSVIAEGSHEIYLGSLRSRSQ